MRRSALLLAALLTAGDGLSALPRLNGRPPPLLGVTPLARPRRLEAAGELPRGFVLGAVADPAPAGLQISPQQMRVLRQSLGLGPAVGVAAGAWPALGVAYGAPAQAVGGEVLRLRALLGTEYVGPAGVGTTRGGGAQVQLSVVYDTGSADLWVSSDLCRGPPCTREGRHRYNHTASPTYRPPVGPKQLRTTYGSAELEGELGADDVRLGPLLARGQGLGMIAEARGEAFNYLPLEGIVGLAFPGLAKDPSTSLVGRLTSEASAAFSQFAFYLHRDLDLGGGIVWGGVDHRLYDGELLWFPVPQELYWAVDLVAFRVGGRAFDFSGAAAGTAPRLILDSGTTFFTAEGALYDAVVEQARPALCSELAGRPSMVYTLRDASGQLRNITIPAQEYMVRGSFDERCLPAVVQLRPLRDGRPSLIAGEVFMRHYLTVFRMRGGPGDPPAVGMARAKFDGGAAAFFQEAAKLGEAAVSL